MAKKNRFDGALEAFASESLSTERTVFGDTTQSDDIDANINADFLRGWGIVGVNDLPTKQDFNAMGYSMGYLLAYLYQAGVPEWNDTQDYHEGQIVNVDGELYKSIQDDNTGNDPISEPTWWSRSGATGDMLKSENLSGLANYTTARDNLGVLGVKGTSIASAATTNIGNADAHFVDITGTTTITSLGTGTARNMVMVNFTGALTLTHNATSLILPGGANITTAAGDTAIFVRNGAAGSGNWRCVSYQRASGEPIVPPFTLTTGISGSIVIGSMRVQWGRTPANNAQGGVVQSFHTAFSGTPWAIFLTPNGNSAPTYGAQTNPTTWSSTQFTVYQSFAVSVAYLAIGPA